MEDDCAPGAGVGVELLTLPPENFARQKLTAPPENSKVDFGGAKSSAWQTRSETEGASEADRRPHRNMAPRTYPTPIKGRAKLCWGARWHPIVLVMNATRTAVPGHYRSREHSPANAFNLALPFGERSALVAYELGRVQFG